MNNKGLLHKLMLVIILVAGFGLALFLPWLKRHTDEKHAQQAVQVLQTLTAQERQFYLRSGFYIADFDQLQIPSFCQNAVKNGQSILQCPGYEVALEQAGILYARSEKYPQWFSATIEQNTVACEYEEGSWVGQYLCKKVRL